MWKKCYHANWWSQWVQGKKRWKNTFPRLADTPAPHLELNESTAWKNLDFHSLTLCMLNTNMTPVPRVAHLSSSTTRNVKNKGGIQVFSTVCQDDLFLLLSTLQTNFYQLLVTFHFDWPKEKLRCSYFKYAIFVCYYMLTRIIIVSENLREKSANIPSSAWLCIALFRMVHLSWASSPQL